MRNWLGSTDRRSFLKGSAALMVAGGTGSGSSSAQGLGAVRKPLPQRGNYVIRGAYVMTMDPRLGDLKSGDVLIQNGEIVKIAEKLDASDARLINGRKMVLLPGFIDAHTHFWSSQMRGKFGDTKESVYFHTRNRLANGFQPEDMYLGSQLGAVEAISSGITTALDFCHNLRSRQSAEACIQALRETGIRARFLYGASTLSKPTEPIDLGHLEKLALDWSRYAGDSPLTLGLGWRGPLGTTTVIGQQMSPAVEIAKREIDTARRLKLPISVHVSGVTAKAQFDALISGGFLGPDMQLVHCTDATVEQLKSAKDAGATVALTPITELRVGYGVTHLSDFLDSGISVGIGIDSNALAGSADMFSVMKLFELIEAGRKRDELAISPRRLLELATIGGATSIGMSDRIGSITPGKRADLILVSTDALNMGMFADDPAHLLVQAAQPSNVDTVLIDGRLLKRNGRMRNVNVTELVEKATASANRIDQRVR